MKQRMITVVYGIALLLIILLFYKTIILNAAIAAVAMLSVYEIFAATKNTRNNAFMAACFLFAAVIPFLNRYYKNDAFIIFFAFMLVLFTLMIFKHKTLRLEQMSLCFMMTMLMTASLSCIIYIRDEFSDSGNLNDLALFYITLVFVGAWVTDAGGYIFGTLFGKHKLLPSVSPKKTIEGAAGGILLTVAASAGILFGYSAYLSNIGIQAEYNYGSMIILALLCAVVSILGDLSASLIKRENSIKDFGKILPGHGGILDRFDSIIFVAPLILVWVRLFPVVTL